MHVCVCVCLCVYTVIKRLSLLLRSKFCGSKNDSPIHQQIPIFLSNFSFSLFFIFSLQGRCNRDKPPCKYFHPPQHLKDQLLINGRNHLALKNALMQQMGMATGQQVIPGQVPAVVSTKINKIFIVSAQHISIYLGAAVKTISYSQYH